MSNIRTVYLRLWESHTLELFFDIRRYTGPMQYATIKIMYKIVDDMGAVKYNGVTHEFEEDYVSHTLKVIDECNSYVYKTKLDITIWKKNKDGNAL